MDHSEQITSPLTYLENENSLTLHWYSYLGGSGILTHNIMYKAS